MPRISVSQLITDHFHLGNVLGDYYMGYFGFEFIRGDGGRRLPDRPGRRAAASGAVPEHFRDTALLKARSDDASGEQASCALRTFQSARSWLDRNHTWTHFYLHIDSFPPHEPIAGRPQTAWQGGRSRLKKDRNST